MIEYVQYIALLLVSLLLLLLIWWYSIYFWYKSYLKGIPKWTPQVPLLGSALKWRDPTGIYEELSKIFDDMCENIFTMVGPLPAVITVDPNLIKLVMTTKKAKKSVIYTLGRNFLGDGVILSDGDRWKTQRKLLNPAFHYNNLERNMVVFSEESERITKILEKECCEDTTDILKYLIEYALITIFETSIGTPFDAIQDKMPSYIDDSIKNISVLYERFCNPLLHFDCFYELTDNYRIEKQVHENITELVDTFIQQRLNVENKFSVSENEESKPILLDLLLRYKKDNNFYTDQLLRDEIHTIIIAATDTTSTTLAYTIHMLANNPEIQEKAFREVRSVYGGKANHITDTSDLSKMVYLQAIIQETLRLYPSVPYLSRQLTENIVYGDITLPKGLIVALLIYGVHKNPKYYQEPEKFMPERFLSEKNANPYCYIPFGAGPRTCIGNKYAMLSMKTFLSKLLMKYELLSINHELILRPEVVLVSKTGFKIRIRPRKC